MHKGSGPDKTEGQPPGQGVDKSSPGDIDVGIFPCAGKRDGKGDRLLGADLRALPALDAFGCMGLHRVLIDRSHRAGLLADQAFIALLAHPALENTERRNKAEQGPQGAEIAAPEPRSQAIQGDDPPKIRSVMADM